MVSIGRRFFLKAAAALAGLGGSWAALRAAFTARGAIDQRVSLGLLRALPLEAPVRRTIAVTEHLGWLRRTVEKQVWIRRISGDAVVVFSATCPHEACSVQQEDGAAGFICLCHRSHFGPDGVVRAGPALRNMDQLEHEIQQGVVWARFQKFKKQVREKVVIS